MKVSTLENIQNVQVPAVSLGQVGNLAGQICLSKNAYLSESLIVG